MYFCRAKKWNGWRGYCRYFYGFLLFDLVFQSEILFNVLLAVTKPANQLMYTALLICIVIFVFGLVALYWYGEDFLSFQLKNAVLTHFFNAMYDVMLPGTAMVVTSEDEFVSRFAFNVLFFVIIGVILMNIVLRTPEPDMKRGAKNMPNSVNCIRGKQFAIQG